jgi:CRP-like cAMP-binding protein
VRIVKRYAGRLMVNMLGHGSLIGAISAYNQGEVTSLATAQTDEVELIEYPLLKLEELFARLPLIGTRFFKTVDFSLAHQLCNQNRQLIDMPDTKHTQQISALPISEALLPESSRDEKRMRMSRRLISHLPLPGRSDSPSTPHATQPTSPRKSATQQATPHATVFSGDPASVTSTSSQGASAITGVSAGAAVGVGSPDPRKRSTLRESPQHVASPSSNRLHKHSDLTTLFELPAAEKQVAQFAVTVRRKRMNLGTVLRFSGALCGLLRASASTSGVFGCGGLTLLRSHAVLSSLSACLICLYLRCTCLVRVLCTCGVVQ